MVVPISPYILSFQVVESAMEAHGIKSDVRGLVLKELAAEINDESKKPSPVLPFDASCCVTFVRPGIFDDRFTVHFRSIYALLLPFPTSSHLLELPRHPTLIAHVCLRNSSAGDGYGATAARIQSAVETGTPGKLRPPPHVRAGARHVQQQQQQQQPEKNENEAPPLRLVNSTTSTRSNGAIKGAPAVVSAPPRKRAHILSDSTSAAHAYVENVQMPACTKAEGGDDVTNNAAAEAGMFLNIKREHVPIPEETNEEEELCVRVHGGDEEQGFAGRVDNGAVADADAIAREPLNPLQHRASVPLRAKYSFR